MTVTSLTSAISHTGTGATDTFTFPFKVFAQTDLVVNTYVIATGALTLLTLTTDYTVTLIDDGNGGGSITLVAGNLPATHKIIIQRVLPITQETDFVENDPFPAESNEVGLDKLTMIIQQLKEQVDRALLGTITTEAGVIILFPGSDVPTITGADALKIIQVNAASTAYELVTVTAAITTVINAAINIFAMTEKNPPISTDIFMIEDSADGYSKKKVQIGNLGIGGSVEVFTSDDTWTKPAGCSIVKAVCIGGGGGGAGGCSRSGVTESGASGGGGGGRVEAFFRATDLGATEAITVGAGGTGQADGVANTAGGNSSFGSWLLAYGGGAGRGGAAGAISGGGGGGSGGVGQAGQNAADSLGGLPSATAGEPAMGGGGGGGDSSSPYAGQSAENGGGGGGGGVNNTANAGGVGGYSIYGGGGGGGGGAINGGGSGSAGGNGGATPKGSGGTGGATGANGTNGGVGTAGDLYRHGTGGGGGGAATGGGGGTGGAGGTGGLYGGGGGGGGAHETGAAGTIGVAVGGAGGKGVVIVYTW